MKITSTATTALSPDAIDELYENLIEELGAPPDFLVINCSAGYDIEEILQRLKLRTPTTPIHGGTSCKGAMTQLGVASENASGFAMLAISDPWGNYGVGGAPLHDDPLTASQTAITKALTQANCPGEVPAMVWLTSAPGHEEGILKGIGQILGDDVPIAGGSSADNTVSGDWKQFANDTVYDDGVVVAALFPSTEVMFAFHSGYEPTAAKGIITKTGGFEATNNRGIATETSRRTLIEIDNRSAATVYNEWVNGAISATLKEGGNILSLTTLHPLGRIAGHIGDVPYYQLSHPDSVTPDGSITLFSDIKKGDEVVLMKGTIDSLISRAGRVAVSALDTHHAKSTDVAGALVVYCAGCMLTVQDRLDEVVDSFRQALPGVPFLGTFTFGEQGCFLNGENRHGNLMISVLLFCK